MKRMLSSRETFVWKFLFPLVWSGAIGLGTSWLFLHNVDATGKPIDPSVKWIFLILWILGTILILWISVPLKRVFRDENNLYISNYRVDTSVPISCITGVRENRGLHIGGKHPIIVELATPTLFGDKIIFIPTGKAPFAWPWQKEPHPITVELQTIAGSRDSLT